jgi:hypothetical protein
MNTPCSGRWWRQMIEALPQSVHGSMATRRRAMIRLTSFVVVFVIGLVACNAQEDRGLRPTPIPGRQSSVTAPVSVNGPGASSGGDGTSAETAGGAGAGDASGDTGGGGGASPGPTSTSCATLQPASNWICVNGGWVPPDHPLATGSAGAAGDASGNAGGSGDASPGPTTTSCTTPQPASNWICVNGGWVPPDHPLAAGAAGSGGANGTGGSSSGGSSGATGTCTTPDPFIGIPGMEGVCVGGEWIPSNHPIALALPVPDYTGVYILIITADSCSPGFPEEARRRVYNAKVEQSGRNLRVFLSGADFLLRSGDFFGLVSPTGKIRFTITEADNYYYYYSVYQLVEQFSDSRALIVSGAIRARATATGIAGTLSGRFTLMDGVTVPFTQTLGNCVADAHRFEMVRQ